MSRPTPTGSTQSAARPIIVGRWRPPNRGMRPLVAHRRLGRGKLYQRLERREEAREDIATATAMFRDMGMTHWLEQAEAEILQLR